MSKAISSLPAALLLAAFALTLSARERAAVTQASAAASQPGAKSVNVEENVSYGLVNGVDLRLDIYKPADSPAAIHPAVLLIHGGGWTGLDKSTMRGMGQVLARSGFVAFAVDYRLFQGEDNRWPAQLDDVQRAVRWLRANAAKYTANSERIGAFGHSAGAQLAALLGMEDTRDNSDPALAKYSSRVQAVVDVSGPIDFTAEHGSDAQGFLASFLGASYATHPEVWREASPAFHVSKADAPFLIVHGTQDQSVPLSQSQELFEKLQSAGVPVSFVKVNDVHTFQTPEARRRLAVETLAFFNRYLRAPIEATQ
jgi:acetyl esterase/lipase